MKTVIAAALCAALAGTAQAGSLDELKHAAAAAGAEGPEAVPTPQSAPEFRGDLNNIVCGMDISYRETVSQIIVIRLAKKISGTATLTCGGRAPIVLSLEGEGLSLGLGIPNQGPFSSSNGVVAGHIQVRLLSTILPKDLEGTYVNVGGEVLGAGASVSPWVNTDGATAVTLYLPSTFNASIALNLTQLTFKLKN